ncbi:MAG: type II/IV secretion system protein [Chitinispirillaceae bacterium]|nr:type II/IV secretion system protein [Chitinispirillaceae bacterium]
MNAMYLDIKDTGVDIANLTGSPVILGNEPARSMGVIPVEHTPLLLITDREFEIKQYNQLRFLLQKDFRLVKVDTNTFDSLFKKTWPEHREGGISSTKHEDFKAKIMQESSSGKKDSSQNIQGYSGGSVIEMVDELFSRAAKVGASDIHLEPAESDLKVRFRLDGLLHQIMSIPKAQQNEMISRLKILAHMDIAEKRRPQDGRILLEGNNRTIDVRVSSMPTINGEKVVLRLLDQTMQKLDLDVLGMKGKNHALFSNAISKPHGMILVTGPTGSGKTTTLYAALKAIHSPEINISTVEDPIEYQLEGINQTQFNPAIDYTFAAAVKTFLRQDPDVIMIGEIRDPETAKYAIQASQTGHLVLSTLHTNDAPGAVVRMLEMGMEPYLVASTVTLVIAQRLVRTSCKGCGEYRALNTIEQKFLERMGGKAERVFTGKGCRECLSSGYRGRIGVYEMMQITPEIQELIAAKSSTPKIREKAIEQGMATLHQEAIKLVTQGITTITEIESAIG